MKSNPDPGRAVGSGGQRGRLSTRFGVRDWFALGFGLFLGLALVKFGNPVILDSKVAVPKTSAELLTFAWPPSWSIWFLIPFGIIGGFLAVGGKARWPASRWLWVLPLVWLAWQLLSATQTVDRELTAMTLWHFAGCIVCFFIGALVMGRDRSMRIVLAGLLAAFAFCLVRAVDQKLIEFPQERQYLLESEQAGWTNMPPEVFQDMKQHGVIITTNGVDVANPVILRKYEKGRVFGTLVYPNALAGAVLMLFPMAIVLVVTGTRRFRNATRYVAIALTVFLGLGGLFWTGSKSGWLIAIGIVAVWLFRLNWPARVKWMTFALVLAVGLGAFGLRFRQYFASGAASVGARFDYWRAAVQTVSRNPVFGSGPGTFQRPYEQLKAPESEMARLTHNDYLEQFSDSGFVGGASYAAWIFVLLLTLRRRVWKTGEPLHFAVFLGLLGWLIQGMTEFSLYIPALAWTAFALAGCLLAVTGNQFDKPAVRR